MAILRNESPKENMIFTEYTELNYRIILESLSSFRVIILKYCICIGYLEKVTI